jgi:hypothetical protein
MKHGAVNCDTGEDYRHENVFVVMVKKASIVPSGAGRCPSRDVFGYKIIFSIEHGFWESLCGIAEKLSLDWSRC